MAIFSKKQYTKLVAIAKYYYAAISILWLLLGLNRNGGINPVALFVLIVFGWMIKSKNLLANLIVGILTMFVSVYMVLQSLNHFFTDLKAHNGSLLNLLLVFMTINCLLMSFILIFSYLKLKFED